VNMLKATVQGLQSLRRPEEVAERRGLTIKQVLPVGAKPEEEAEAAPQAAEAAPEAAQETEDGDGQDQASS